MLIEAWRIHFFFEAIPHSVRFSKWFNWKVLAHIRARDRTTSFQNCENLNSQFNVPVHRIPLPARFVSIASDTMLYELDAIAELGSNYEFNLMEIKICICCTECKWKRYDCVSESSDAFSLGLELRSVFGYVWFVGLHIVQMRWLLPHFFFFFGILILVHNSEI